MKMCGMLGIALGVCLTMIGAAAPVAAQTNDEVPYPQLQWNFSTPGARANGMGGSFIGLADDATAAITNPAGLMNLTRPQVYAEYKNTRLKTDRLATFDSLTTLVPTSFESTVNALSFLSVSLPIKSKLAAAFSLHRFLDYHEQSSLDARRNPTDATRFFFPIVGTYDFTGTAYGGSIAYMVTQQLRLGVTVAANVLDTNSDAKRYDFEGTSTTGFTRSSVLANEVTTIDTQTAASASVGALYRFNDMVSAGFNYERGPKFNSTVNKQVNPGFRLPDPPGTGTNQPLVQAADFPEPAAMAFNVPDRFGFGAAVRPNGKLLVTADVVRVMYSSLTASTTIVFNPTVLTGSEYRTPDITEFHAGAEYSLFSVNGNPLFVRAGVFTNPNHQTQFTGTSDPAVNNAQNLIFNSLVGKDETRGTFGVGIALARRAQVDAAYVFGKEFVLSAGVRF